MIPAIIGAAAALVPEVISWFDDDAGDAARRIGGIVQSVTGTDDPAAARTALEDPATAARLKEALLAFRTRHLEEETKRLVAINETIRAEAGSANWWSSAWRPFWGAVSAIAFLVAVAGIIYLAGYAIAMDRTELLQHIPTLVFQLAALFAIPGAILGVASWHRGKEHRIRAGERMG